MRGYILALWIWKFWLIVSNDAEVKTNKICLQTKLNGSLELLKINQQIKLSQINRDDDYFDLDFWLPKCYTTKEKSSSVFNEVFIKFLSTYGDTV